MPLKRLREPKKVMKKLPETAGVGKMRRMRSEAAEKTRTMDGNSLKSLIPVVRRRGRPSLVPKFNWTVDIQEALKGLEKGFFVGEEKDFFKTRLKGRSAESQQQRQSATGLRSSPTSSMKRGTGGLGSSSHGSPGSVASSSDSPYFLRSKGAAGTVFDNSLLHPKRIRRSVGLASAEKESPPRRGRKSLLSPPPKKTEAEKSPVLSKAGKASSSGRKDDSQENSIVDKKAVEMTKGDAAKPTAFVRMTTGSQRQTKMSQDQRQTKLSQDQRQTKTSHDQRQAKTSYDQRQTKISHDQRQTKMSQDQNSDECANIAEKAVLQVETGKKRKRDQDEIDDLLTKRAKVMMVDAAKILEMMHEPNQKLTSGRLVLRANDKDLSDKMVLKSDGEQASYGQTEEKKNRVQEKDTRQTSAEKEVSRTVQKSTRGQVASVVSDSQMTPSQNSVSVFESVKSSALVGQVQSLNDASGDLEETGRKKLHDLTANISVRSSWSAHLYDKVDGPVSKVPRLSVASHSQPKLMDVPRPLSAVTPSVDFQVNWDTSAVKDRLLSSIRPQKTQADELTTVPKEAISQPSSNRLQEQSDVVLTNFLATPLRRPDIDKPVFDRDVLEFGENVPLSLSRKMVCAEEEMETRRRSASRLNAATPFNNVNDASLRRSVDRLVPNVNRENIVRGRSVEPGMIQTTTIIHKQPKFNGQLAGQELKLVDQMRGGRCGRVFRRLLCFVGTPVLVIGCGYLVHLALAAGYLGEFF